MNRPTKPAVLVLATGIVLVLVVSDWTPLVRGPAPYPPEWQWIRQPKSTLSRGGVACASAAGLIGLIVLTGTEAARRRSGAAAAAVLGGATILGFGFQWGLLKLEREDAAPTLLRRTISDTFTSHYFVAVSPAARDVPAFLDRHAELLRQFHETAPHAATHPPGPVLYYRAILAVCEASPGVTDRVIDWVARPRIDLRPFRLPAEGPLLATALLGAMLLMVLCSAACWPVAGLARTAGMDALGAARIGVLWALLPGPALMVPLIDQALALPVAAATTVLAGALVRSPSRALLVRRAAVAGILGGIALLLSYGSAVFLLVGGAAAVGLSAGSRPWAGRAAAAAGSAGAAATAVFMLPAVLGHEPLEAVRTALSIHREAFTAVRSYGLWLLFNPWDLALFLGIPIALLGLGRSVHAVAAMVRQPSLSALPPCTRMRGAVAVGVALLLLSGLVRGEIGRILIPLMPVLLVAALAVPTERHGAAAGRSRAAGPSPGEAVLLAVLLPTSCVVIRLCWHVP